jgi:hypothetical protein
VGILSDIEQLKRLKELVEPNQDLISYKLEGEDCLRIHGNREILDCVEEEIKTRHHDLKHTRRDTCLKVCIRPPFSQLMSDSIHKHEYAEMEE